MPHRRSIYLINWKFQLRFSFFVCSWLFALSVVYPIIIYNLFSYFIRYAARDPNGPPLLALHQIQDKVFWILILFQVIFLVVTFLISVFVSHRIAGPLYKLRKFFEKAKSGDFSEELHFRKNDHFQELAADYNSMARELKTRLSKTSTEC